MCSADGFQTLRQVMASDEGRLRPFQVRIKWVASVSIKSLLHFIGCAPGFRRHLISNAALILRRVAVWFCKIMCVQTAKERVALPSTPIPCASCFAPVVACTGASCGTAQDGSDGVCNTPFISPLQTLIQM